MEREPQHPDGNQPSLLDIDPVPFVLTARARRIVAPESLPALAIVAAPVDNETGSDVADDEESAEDLGDPRRARARALRRAGTAVDAIARELTIDEARVQRWTRDVAPAQPAARREVVAARRRQAELPAAYASGRAAARSAWKRGTAVSSGAAMVAGLAEVTPFAVRLRGELAVVGGLLQWLRDSVGLGDTTVRAQVAAAPGRAMDQLAHEVAERLRLEPAAVAARPWADAPDADSVEVVVRISDPHLAGTIAGWREGLLAELLADPSLLAEVVAVS